MSDYTLEEVIDFINDEIGEAYESAYCDDVVEGVIDAYEDGVISYEAAEEYIDIITEARRLDKEILKRKELFDRYDKLEEDSEIPDSLKGHMWRKVKDQTNLRSARGTEHVPGLNSIDRHKNIKDAVENRKNGTKISASLWNDDLEPAKERKPGKYLEIQKKLNDHKTGLTLPKKVNTKVSQYEDELY